MRILGIDPGTAVTGYGVIETSGSYDYHCLSYGTIRSKANQELPPRLKKIYDGIADVIDQFQPEHVALEDVFHGRNIQTALKLGQARGAAIIAAINAEKIVDTYSAREVKMSLTGYGAASKEQVQRMVGDILKLKAPITPLDASDALAIALCHAQRWWVAQKMKNSR